MKARYSALILISLFVLTLGHTTFTADEIFEKDFSLAGHKYVPGEIVVKFKPGTASEEIRNINARHATSVIATGRMADFKRLRIPKRKTVEEMVKIYKQNPNVEYAELNYIAHTFFTPDDSYYSLQWHLHNSSEGGINMPAAWDITAGASDVIVAVIDTGVSYENYSAKLKGKRRASYYLAPDLAQTSFVPGYDFVNNDSHANDDHSHGTHVTGTIAQSTNNSLGVAGIAFDVSIMPIKVLGSTGSGNYTDIADGIFLQPTMVQVLLI